MAQTNRRVSSACVRLSQKPALAEPGFELGQMLCTGYTCLARLGWGPPSRPVRGLLLLFFCSLQSSFRGWWKNTEYGFLWMAPVLLTAKCCCQKHVVSLGERWGFCWGQEADLDTGDESHTKQGIAYKVGLKTRKCFLYGQTCQEGSGHFSKTSLTWSSKYMAWTRDWLVECEVYRNFGFGHMCFQRSCWIVTH